MRGTEAGIPVITGGLEVRVLSPSPNSSPAGRVAGPRAGTDCGGITVGGGTAMTERGVTAGGLTEVGVMVGRRVSVFCNSAAMEDGPPIGGGVTGGATIAGGVTGGASTGGGATTAATGGGCVTGAASGGAAPVGALTGG